MDKMTIVRTVVLAFALLNQGLVALGYSPLPFEEAEVEAFVSTLLTVGAALLAWWYDNDVTKETIEKKKEASMK